MRGKYLINFSTNCSCSSKNQVAIGPLPPVNGCMNNNFVTTWKAIAKEHSRNEKKNRRNSGSLDWINHLNGVL